MGNHERALHGAENDRDRGPDEEGWALEEIIDTGEITTTAAVDGRRITLDPVLPLLPLDARPRRVENSLPAGFRIGWLRGDDGELAFEVTAGAGVGSKYLVLTVKEQATGNIYAEEVIDIAELTGRWLSNILNQGETPKETPDVDSAQGN